MLKVAMVVSAGLLMLPAAARAQLPAAHPPGHSVAGVKLSWPTTASFSPGAKVGVKVRSSHRRARLSLVRVDGRGTPTRAIARRTLRSGTFTATLPQDPGASYELRAVVAGKRYYSWIVTLRTPYTPPVPTVGPGGMQCPAAGGESARLDLGAASVAAGGALPYSLVNTGADCLTAGGCYALERQEADGSWTRLPSGPCPDFAVILRPGGTYPKSALIPANTAPGAYRLDDSVWGLATIPLTAAFTVTAA